MTAPSANSSGSTSTRATTASGLVLKGEAAAGSASPTPLTTMKSLTRNNSTPIPDRNININNNHMGRSSRSQNGSQNGATSSSNNPLKKGTSSLMKLPKKLLTSGKYPKQKIVKDSIPFLDDEVAVMTSDAPFIKAVPGDNTLCLLDRKEIILGDLLGQGQFAQVFQVKEMKLRDNASNNLTPAQQATRQSFVTNFKKCPSSPDHSQKCHRYAIKHLKRDLLVKQSGPRMNFRRHNAAATEEIAAGDTDLPMDQQFQLAAADLVVEALYLSRIAHPSIIKVRGLARGGTAAFENGRYDSYFLILDKLSQTLDQRIRHWRHTQGQPQEEQLCMKTEHAYSMAQALEYLHQRRIIYRDLKPSNIGFKEEDDRLQIFDFGLCRELPPSKHNDTDPNELYFMTAAGTHRYMAVEVLMGQEYNVKADVYSFSMVYYELLAQEAPFLNFGEDHHKKLVCERKHRPQHFFGCVVPLSIQNLLNDAWAHEVADRLSMTQVVQRLEDILVNTFQQTLQEQPDGVKKVVAAPNKMRGVSASCGHNHAIASPGA